ncbi:expressed protein [Phakopsora pachyrhizi]|uniref:Expressed protein n=1 Tax=Phakopsora pachyrhizi TaxID=170000 RepID=A0AAV0B594_PHAPC|nr:expressed protein [Phakopsora pachyrhizi]
MEGFPNCVGFVDGTPLPLSQKPALDENEDYFEDGDYILADSAYASSDVVVPAFWVKLNTALGFLREEMESLIKWVGAFIVLHNMLASIVDIWEEFFMDDEELEKEWLRPSLSRFDRFVLRSTPSEFCENPDSRNNYEEIYKPRRASVVKHRFQKNLEHNKTRKRMGAMCGKTKRFKGAGSRLDETTKNSVKLKVIQAEGPIQANSDAALGSSRQQQLSSSKKNLRDDRPRVTTVDESDLSSEQSRRLRLEAVESRLKAQSTRGTKNGTLNQALNQQKSDLDRVNQAINEAKRKEKDKNLVVKFYPSSYLKH